MRGVYDINFNWGWWMKMAELLISVENTYGLDKQKPDIVALGSFMMTAAGVSYKPMMTSVQEKEE
jgi:hypothetical protein